MLPIYAANVELVAPAATPTKLSVTYHQISHMRDTVQNTFCVLLDKRVKMAPNRTSELMDDIGQKV